MIEINKAGQKAIFDINVKGLSKEIVDFIGRLKFRYSNGENVIQHTIELARLAGILAGQKGLDQAC